MNKNKIDNFLQEWGNCITTQNLEKLLSLYSDQAILKPTLSDKIRNSYETIKDYFVGTDSHPGFLHQGIIKVEFMNVHQIVEENIGITVGQYIFTKNNGESVMADFTYTLKADSEMVQILSHHSSLTYK